MYIIATRKLNVSSVSEMITNIAVFSSPRASSSISSYSVRSRSSFISNGASRAPQEIRMDLAVLPVAICQGLFNQALPIFNETYCVTLILSNPLTAELKYVIIIEIINSEVKNAERQA